MKRKTLLILILAAALSAPFAVHAENETVETPEDVGTVWESEAPSETVTEPEMTGPVETKEEAQTPEEPKTEEDLAETGSEKADLTEEQPAEEPEEQPAQESEEESEFFVDPETEPEEQIPAEGETENGSEDDEFVVTDETEEEKEKQQELDTARAENKDAASSIAPVTSSIYVETIAHPCKGNLLSAEKYGRFQGLTDFTFFTAQESGSYSAYHAGNGLVVLGKYQFTDFGSQGNGTATALVEYMYDSCEEAVDLYGALYQAFVVEKRTAVDEWNACALNDTENFMAMQDRFAYEHYYARGEAAVEAAGISLKNRPWVVKGMCFSIFNALGPYNEYGSGAYAITTAGITEEDSNAAFIEKICARMVSLYADKYTWMYGRYDDGSNTALGVSDKDLALEILSGSLYSEPEPVSNLLSEVLIKEDPVDTIKKDPAKTIKKSGIYASAIQVTAKEVREYTQETKEKVLKLSKDYTLSWQTNEKQTQQTLIIKGKGVYEGQVLKKQFLLDSLMESK